MITREPPAEVAGKTPAPVPPEAGGGGHDDPPPPRRGDGWWRSWPTPPNRPRPLNRSSLLRGGMVVSAALLLVDGTLGVMAWQATGRWLLGLAVGGVLFAFTAAEFAVVAWAVKLRQEQEIRNSRE